MLWLKIFFFFNSISWFFFENFPNYVYLRNIIMLVLLFCVVSALYESQKRKKWNNFWTLGFWILIFIALSLCFPEIRDLLDFFIVFRSMVYDYIDSWSCISLLPFINVSREFSEISYCVPFFLWLRLKITWASCWLKFDYLRYGSIKF